MAGRVFNGQTWEDIVEYPIEGKQRPVPPILDGDGKIFVSIPSFRDGERCGKTIVDLFAKAKDPDSIVVGIIDQRFEEDLFCLESYCKEMGVETYQKRRMREDTTKVMTRPEMKDCPRLDQIRNLSIFNTAAKGPVFARSLVRKILGNEEFCLQIDAHSNFVSEWDDKLKHEWAATGNEFGIISTVPPALADMETEASASIIPRQCTIQFQEIGIPAYAARGDGKVENLQKPLLSHAWSAGFSFSKCHLEESVPYDPFTPYVMGVEQFARYARLWTRGYDVYTPTQNIIYHNYQQNPDGHGPMEWLRPRFQRFRQASLKRIRTYLELPDGLDGYNLANLGIYGLGKRRSLKDMTTFLKINLEIKGSRPEAIPCGDDRWVPYDSNISPVENLYDKPDDLDPQPEFPLRSQLTFYEEAGQEPPKLEVLEGDILGGDNTRSVIEKDLAVEQTTFPSALLMFVLWVLGLVAWCSVFLRSGSSSGLRRKRRSQKKSSNQKLAKDA